MGGRKKGDEQEPKAPAQFTIIFAFQFFFGWCLGERNNLIPFMPLDLKHAVTSPFPQARLPSFFLHSTHTVESAINISADFMLRGWGPLLPFNCCYGSTAAFHPSPLLAAPCL